MTRQRSILVSFILLFCLMAVATPQDTKQRESQLKTVHGEVMDKSDNKAPNSVVFLRNTRTNQVRSFIADEAGEYRFSGLDPNTDYEIHAEKDALKSQIRSVSSFDSRKDLTLNLKLDKKKD